MSNFNYDPRLQSSSHIVTDCGAQVMLYLKVASCAQSVILSDMHTMITKPEPTYRHLILSRIISLRFRPAIVQHEKRVRVHNLRYRIIF